MPLLTFILLILLLSPSHLKLLYSSIIFLSLSHPPFLPPSLPLSLSPSLPSSHPSSLPFSHLPSLSLPLIIADDSTSVGQALSILCQDFQTQVAHRKYFYRSGKLVLLTHIISYLIFYPIYHIISILVLSCLVLSCLVLSCLVLSCLLCHVISYNIISYLSHQFIPLSAIYPTLYPIYTIDSIVVLIIYYADCCVTD